MFQDMQRELSNIFSDGFGETYQFQRYPKHDRGKYATCVQNSFHLISTQCYLVEPWLFGTYFHVAD